MNWHFIGDEPYPTPYKASSATHETSLAVLQFMELVRGERPVMKEANPFRVQKVKAEEHYCLHCFGLHCFDVVYGVTEKPQELDLDFGADVTFRIRRCRHCGKESGG